MKTYLIVLLLTLPLLTSVTTTAHRRILHQPLFPVSSTPPSLLPSPSSPPTPDNPFFNENPNHHTPDQPQPPPPPDVAAGVANNDKATPSIAPPPGNNSGKKVAVVISVGIVTLGMLSGLAFFIYKHKSKQQTESGKLVPRRPVNEELPENFPAAMFLHIGTVEPTIASESSNGTSNGSPYNKLNSVKTSDRYRPSPDLQPLPPLIKPPPPPPAAAAMTSDEEEEIHDFYTPHGSNASTDEGHSLRGLNIKRIHRRNSSPNPNTKRSSPRSRLSISSSPDSVSENTHPANSPAKQPSPRLHINQSQQKPKIPTPPQHPSAPPGAFPTKTTSTSPAAKVIPKIIKPKSSQ